MDLALDRHQRRARPLGRMTQSEPGGQRNAPGHRRPECPAISSTTRPNPPA